MIVLTRIDHRLLHGQVSFLWVRNVGADCILIANDSLAKDNLRMSALRLARPAGVKLVMKSVEDSIKSINEGETDKYNLLIIVENVDDAHRLALGCPAIKSINVGGMKNAEDRKQISKAVFVSENDIEKFKEMHEKGIELEIRMVPNDQKIDVMTLI
ncbi:MAG: PTS sugar transporter subunit IIB [Bacillota bacterium]|jgi:fructoselysine and glucoselysine-specific PTS system IIB component|nr:PTS sugar transporter subunit IIB [Bacillota bacterium]NLL26435.1 PTS sugar transporter subunit IIB [Erysipelotrichia bacterium]